MLLTADTIIARATDFGLSCQTQSAWHKIANRAKAVYLSKTVRKVTAIHISGFVLKHPAVVKPPKKNGAVTGHIDLEHPEAEAALFLALGTVAQGFTGFKAEAMRAAKVAKPATVRKPRAERKPKVDFEAVAAKKVAELEAEMKAERLLKIKAAVEATPA